MSEKDDNDLKKRARRRLVGAIALVLLAAILLPPLMDSEPTGPEDEVRITIPQLPTQNGDAAQTLAANTAAPTEGTAPASGTENGNGSANDDSLPLPPSVTESPDSATPSAPVQRPGEPPLEPFKPVPIPPAEPPKAQAPKAESAKTTPPAPPKTEAKPEAKPEPKREAVKKPEPAKKPEATKKPEPAKSETKTETTKADAKADSKANAAKDREAERKRAEAALKGLKPEPKPAAKPAENSGGRRYLVQVAAVSSPEKANSIAATLRQQGFSAYTEKAGNFTRIRVGGYTNREAAEAAAAKIRGIKADVSFSPSVLPQ